jgi:hypothetical protein
MATKPEIFQVMQATFMKPPASSHARGTHSLFSKTPNLQLEVDDGFGQPKGWSNSITGTSENMGSRQNNRKLAGSLTKREVPALVKKS